MSLAARRQLDALSVHLRRRQEALLTAWRNAVRHDPELTTNLNLSGSARDDHIPKILEDYSLRLRAEHALDATQVDLEQRRDAAKHGMHRWQQGYDIRETMREWGHLQSVVLRELDRYAADHAELQRDVMSTAREILAALCMEGNCESASRYVRLQQTAAAGRLRDLEASLNSLQVLENERAALLRQTAHDLRGSVGVIANATALLAKADVHGPQRDRFHQLLQEKIYSMGGLLTALADLARLEAGQDPLRLETLDAAQRVREYCDLLRPIAADRNLFLKCEGPESLCAQGDSLKLQRIVQNLLLNALQATKHGGVVVRLSAGSETNPQRWTLSLEDTGPGFALQSVGPLRHALKNATDKAHEAEAAAAARQGETRPVPGADTPAAASGPRSASLPSGEGIGLSIVMRLCELLSASVELDTAPGHGTTIRIAFPMQYPSASTR